MRKFECKCERCHEAFEISPLDPRMTKRPLLCDKCHGTGETAPADPSVEIEASRDGGSVTFKGKF